MWRTLDRDLRRWESAKAHSKVVKLALIRDNSTPVGLAARVHVNCPCGTECDIHGPVNECGNCHATYSGLGYVIEGRY